VGYLLKVPLSTYEALPAPGQKVLLLTYLHVTDDALTLFGFATPQEREFFLQLLQHVSGVGPKLALAVLSGGRIERLQQAIRLGDFATLKAIRGVGDATAKRIVLELGKILVKQAASAPRAAPASAAPALGVVQAPGLAGLDEMTDLAVKAVAQLNEVPSDVALRAVQQAFDALRAEGKTPGAVQDLIRRALAFTE
jgi:Holliday junction DNA helicase RuvA